MNDEWYLIGNVYKIDSPALVIYKERVLQNILLATRMVKNTGMLRPHVKTNKISEVCKMMMDAGIAKFKCATIAEAEMLALLNAKDVLLAYQPVGPKANRLLQLMQQYPNTEFSCLTDNADTAQELSALFASNNVSINVFIDVNTGMNRSGIKPGYAFELYELIESLPGLRFKGLHGYDGHIRATDITERRQQTDAAFELIEKLEEKIHASQKEAFTIVAGGSPTFPVHATRANIECSPGTFVFWDWGYTTILPDEPFECAALVITRIISIMDETTMCTDLGHKSVAAENPLPRVHFLNAPEVSPVGQSEEHLVAKVPDTSKYKVGNVLYGVPVHICPTVALYDKAVVIENNSAVDTWRVVARDRMITV